MRTEASVHSVSARAYTVPTDAPEADGTASWKETTIVVAKAAAGGIEGVGYTYADASAAGLVNGKLARVVEGHDAMDPPGAWRSMQQAIRNLGRAGLCATAISAVDAALWDLKAKLLDVPLATLLGRYRVRAAVPATMEVAAGEYGYEPDYFRRMLAADAVDVQQADATRCGGVSGFLHAASLCEGFHTDLSAHCAPALHCHLGCAAPRFRHQEWFHDHVRIEHMLFDGAPTPKDGQIAPDWQRPGLGLVFKQQDAECFGVRAG